jgi:presqualene diphosphate synthase
MTNAENIGAPAAKAVKKKASGSSFYIAMRLMPEEERDAMFAIYAFCRKVDDIADDGVGTRAQRHEKLEQWRDALRGLYVGMAGQQVRFLAPAVARYGLRLRDFLDVLDGMDMDVAEDIVAPDLATLDLYCDRVASAVGRLSIKVFGMEEGPGFELAHHLGRALQLTNILRDVKGDLERGRVYLPLDDLAACGCTVEDLEAGVVTAPVREIIEFECRRARGFYQQAVDARPAEDRKRLIAAEIMRAVYFETLKRIERSGHDVFTARARVPKPRQALIAVRQWLRN